MNEPLHTAPKPFVFVLMPFSKEFDDVYKLAIKPACANAGAYCERVDEQHYDEGMLDRIYNQIAKADFIIANMSGKNANVFYEVGYAHALDKRVILVTNDTADIPFDLKHRPHIVYKSVSELLEELGKRVRWAVENPKRIKQFTDRKVAVYIDSNELIGNPLIGVAKSEGHFSFSVNLHNEIGRVIEPLKCQFALEVSSEFSFFRMMSAENSSSGYSRSTINLGNGKTQCIVEDEFELLPDSWQKIYCRCALKEGADFLEDQEILIKLFTPSGTLSYPARLTEIPEK